VPEVLQIGLLLDAGQKIAMFHAREFIFF
jgi:hypothetical protein